jgi:hypothetical protein
MKKIFTLVAVLVSIASFSFAADRPVASKISITNSQRGMLQVKIDGSMYDLGSSLALDNLRSGNHSITIYKIENSGFRKKTQVLYNSSLFIGNARQLNIDISRLGKIATSQVSLMPDRNDHFNGNNKPYDNNGHRDDHYRH